MLGIFVIAQTKRKKVKTYCRATFKFELLPFRYLIKMEGIKRQIQLGVFLNFSHLHCNFREIKEIKVAPALQQRGPNSICIYSMVKK